MAMISMLIGILTAFFVYNDAKGRGHGVITALLWSVGSVVVPYVILPLYLLVGRRVKQQNKDVDSDVIDIEATVVEETVMEEINVCSKCGGVLQEDVVMCPYCKTPVSPQTKDN